MVLRKLIYGLNTAMFESREESPDLTTGNVAPGALTGVPHNRTGHRIPCDKFSTGEACRPCWETSPQDECDLSDGTLEHNPTGGQETGQAGH